MNIVLGISGGIAAYKSAALCRLLVKAGHDVRVVMTSAAKQFITPLTMATLSKNPILVEFFDPENGEWHSHVRLADWADLMIVAPATANTIAKMASGIADNLLLTVYLSARCRVLVAPAMDCDMYAHPTTKRNIDQLRSDGVIIVEPEAGELASGLTGMGRMAEPEQIAARVAQLFGANHVVGSLAGKHLLVTAGATVEPIDPVRFISNHSTGRMGYAVAAELATRGARVTLISGPTTVEVPEGVERVDVTTAQSMYEAFMARFNESDGAVMCAAVADYTPAFASPTKIKKSDDDMSIALKRTLDIAAEAGRIKQERVLVGFALETDNEQNNAQEKLKKKNLDFIVLNSLRDKGAGFATTTNKVSIIDRAGRTDYPLESKREVAVRIADRIEKEFEKRKQA